MTVRPDTLIVSGKKMIHFCGESSSSRCD